MGDVCGSVPAAILIAIDRGDPPLLALRNHFALSEQECARLSGLRREDIEGIEVGGKTCDALAIERMAAALGIRAKQLVW